MGKPESKKIAGDSLDTFWGEFLVTPAPLELSFNYCSHKCAYCFANLNKPARWADVKKTMRLLADYQNRKTLTAHLLKQGYPVVCSNRVDPFAVSNYLQAVPVLQAMIETGLPIAYQTKGGKGIDEILAIAPKAHWYVSISMLDDAVRRKIEPGAPTIQSRFELIEKLSNAGHSVSVAVNPLVKEWLPDPLPLLQEVKKRGAYGIWVEHLHLNKKQIANSSERELNAMGTEVVTEAQRRKLPIEVFDFIKQTKLQAQSIGLEAISTGQPEPSNYFSNYRKHYKKTFPVWMDYVNSCHVDGDTERLRSFAEYYAVMEPFLPKGVFECGHYLGATAHNIFAASALNNYMTFKQLLSIIWKDHRTQQHPGRMYCFARAVSNIQSKTCEEWVDEDKLPYFLYDPTFFDLPYCEVVEKKGGS